MKAVIYAQFPEGDEHAVKTKSSPKQASEGTFSLRVVLSIS